MNKIQPWQRWFSGRRATAERPPQDDPADLGTAYGLELSLEQAMLSSDLPERQPGTVKRRSDRHRHGD